MPDKKKSIFVYIVREPVGGIWKHIEILINYFQKNKDIILIGNLTDGDKKFKSFRRRNNSLTYIDIQIERKPAISDYKNIKHIKSLLNDYNNIDIIHGHGAKGGIYARVLGVSIPAKIIYTPHGGSVHSSYGKIQTLFYRFIENALYFITDKIVVESKYTCQKYKKMLLIKVHTEKKIVLNYNGINCPNIHSNSNSCAKELQYPIQISSFGMLRYEKGQDILILAVEKVINKGKSIIVHLYGEGDYRLQYENLIRSKYLEKHIFLHGEINDVESKMRESHLIIQPSRFESFGYVLLEAMCVGIPVIASDTGGMSEIMEHDINGRIFKNDDVDSLVEEIEYVLKNYHKTNKYIINGRKTIYNKFRSKTMCKKLSIIYES